MKWVEATGCRLSRPSRCDNNINHRTWHVSNWSEGESPLRRYMAVDHLNGTRAVVTDDGAEKAFTVAKGIPVRMAPPRPHRNRLSAIVTEEGPPERGAD